VADFFVNKAAEPGEKSKLYARFISKLGIFALFGPKKKILYG